MNRSDWTFEVYDKKLPKYLIPKLLQNFDNMHHLKVFHHGCRDHQELTTPNQQNHDKLQAPMSKPIVQGIQNT